MRRWPYHHSLRFGALALGSLVLAGRAVAQTAPAPAEVAIPGADAALDRRTLIAPGEAPDLFLVYTGGVMGYLDACG